MVSSAISRSVYVSRLRRAFLLRAHPDRFQSFDDLVRQRQETLVKAITNRMNQPDFLAYTYGGRPNRAHNFNDHGGTIPFCLIQNDGSLLHRDIDLNQQVEDFLLSMTKALTLTGASTMPPPPPAPPTATNTSPPQQAHHGVHWAPESSTTSIDPRYDIHSIRGRDLRAFLGQMDMNKVQMRRSHRFDVTAAALIVRQRFGFSAVDGTGLGWSSQSFAILLRSLSSFHQEHREKLISTFYPFRLVWSSEDRDDPLDVFGGILYLDPASTPIQWLNHLLQVNENRIDDHKQHQQALIKNTTVVASHLGVQLVKGLSCPSKDYHDLVRRMAEFLGEPPNSSSGAVALERIQVTAESPQACRRTVVTKEGTIRVGASMPTDSILSGISRLAPDARKRRTEMQLARDTSKATVERINSELGLERVFPVKPLQMEDMTEPLIRLLQHEDRDFLRQSFAGNALAIASPGQFCHLGDDGSFVIPLDWH